MKKTDHKILGRITNVADLLDDGVENGSDLKQVQESQHVVATVEKRSTTDPYSVHFAEADIAEGLDRASRTIRSWAWIFLAAPPFIAWLFLVFMLITAPDPNLPGFHVIDLRSDSTKLEQELTPWILGAIGLVPALFWPYVLLRKRRKK
jgi:hypothetical protein